MCGIWARADMRRSFPIRKILSRAVGGGFIFFVFLFPMSWFFFLPRSMGALAFRVGAARCFCFFLVYRYHAGYYCYCLFFMGSLL